MGRRPLKKKHLKAVRALGIHPEGRAWVSTTGGAMGRRVYIPGSIPGEVYDVVYTASGDYLSGTIQQIIQVSEMRTNPFCRHFGLCGGCTWQHISYQAQLDLKVQILKDSLLRAGLEIPERIDSIASPEEIFFRNRIEYAFSDTRWFYENEGSVSEPEERIGLGFQPDGISGRIIHINECFLQAYPSRQIAELFFEKLKSRATDFWNFKTSTGIFRNLEIRSTTAGDFLVVLGVTDGNVPIANRLLEEMCLNLPENIQLAANVLSNATKALPGAEWHFVRGDGFLYEKSGAYTFRFGPESFYQTNPKQANQLFEYVSTIAEVKAGEVVYDLYSGIGTLGTRLSENAFKVIGIEGNQSAVIDAEYNAVLNGTLNMKHFCGDVLKTFNIDFMELHGYPDVIVLDPPRSGTLIEINKNIILSGASRLIYVSCNPLALARDLKLLCEAYDITKIRVFDMFPHTAHLETVVLLKRKTGLC